jgi:nuclear pore complex protein Nup188
VLQAERIKRHHAWLRGSVSMFGKPNDASRAALDATQVAVGEHRLAVKPELKEAALRLSKSLVICCLSPFFISQWLRLVCVVQ